MLHRKMLAVVLTASLPMAAHAAAESYTIDPAHTFPNFTINHLGFSTMHGRFEDTSGKVTLDRTAKKGKVDISIKTASISTGFAKRDDHLKSPDFFNAAEYPTITYKSDKVMFKGDVPSSVEGNLSMNGVTKPVTLTITAFNCGPNPMDPTKKQVKCGADASTQIKRSDFGVKFALPAVGDDVKLEFEIEAIKD